MMIFGHFHALNVGFEADKSKLLGGRRTKKGAGEKLLQKSFSRPLNPHPLFKNLYKIGFATGISFDNLVFLRSFSHVL